MSESESFISSVKNHYKGVLHPEPYCRECFWAVLKSIEIIQKERQRSQVLVEALMDAECLITNLKVYHSFPSGGDCDEVKGKIREALKKYEEMGK